MGRPKKTLDSHNDLGENSISQDVSKNMLNSLLLGYKEDHYNLIEKSESKVISTGSLILDSLIKIRSGSIVRLVAKTPETGKTSECFVLAANYMKEFSKSKTLFIMAEARLSEELKARSGHKFVYNPEEWDYGTVFVFKSNIFETVAQCIESMLKCMYEQSEKLCIIIDSLDGLILRNDYSKNLWGGSDGKGQEQTKLAGVPLLTKLLFRKIGHLIYSYDALMLVTGQYSADIKIDPYSPNIPRQGDSAGGSAIQHWVSECLSYQPRYQSDYILENDDAKPDPIKNKILGVYATIEIKKSASDVTGTKIKIPIAKGRIGSAIWIEKEVVDMALMYELLKKGGAWYSFASEILTEAKEDGLELQEKFQGIKSVYDYFNTNKPVFDWFYKKFQEIIN